MRDEDIEVKQWPTTRRGGQHVGTPVAVIVMHKPTGIGVVVDSERSLHASKVRAIKLLCAIVEREGAADPVASAMEAWACELETSVPPHLGRFLAAEVRRRVREAKP